jgi:hypothetical protein
MLGTTGRKSMARNAWIGILSFGLFLFILFTGLMVWYAATTKGLWLALAALLWFGLLTWDTYVALRRRIRSGPDKKALYQGTTSVAPHEPTKSSGL